MEPIITPIAPYHTTDVYILLVLLFSPFGIAVFDRYKASLAEAVGCFVDLEALHRRGLRVDEYKCLLASALASSLLELHLLLDTSNFVTVVYSVYTWLLIKCEQSVFCFALKVVFVAFVALFQ